MKRLLLLLASATALLAQGDFALRDGDTVVFYGDSITDQRLYTTFVETYVLTRFPDRQIRFVHSGWGGDRVSGGGGGPVDVRLQRDVLTYQPSVVTIMLGMNDGRYRAMDPAIFDDYKKGYEHIVDTLQQARPGLRLTFIQPSPYDDVTRPPTFAGGYNGVLRQYGDYLAGLAQRRKALIADLNTPVVEMLRQANAADPATAQKIIPDRVHPGASGHLIMAEGLLKAWNAPAVVTDVSLDASTGQAARSDNTTVSEIKTGYALSWTQQDRALPFPLEASDPATALVLRSSDFTSRLNRQMLAVTGLSNGRRYELRIDGTPVGVYSASELATGMNLATLPTPMAKQAKAVHELTLRHTGLHQARWRQLQVPLTNDHPPHLQSAMEQLDALEQDLIAMQRAAAKPLAYHYELRPMEADAR